jgi:TM2 domain-containing membrane protein YozV
MKDKNIAALLAIFGGGLGAHKFYLGQVGWGIMYFMFSWTGLPWLAGFIEFIILATMDTDTFNRRFNGSRTLGQPMVVNMLPPAYGQPVPVQQYGAGPSRRGQPAPDLATQLKKLHELRVTGLLTEEEFAQQKAKLLDSM